MSSSLKTPTEPNRVNPFKQFVDKNKSPAVLNLESLDPFNGEVVSPLETSLENQEFVNASQEGYANVGGDTENWVQYLDDESGHLYWYNSVTGETRWLTEEETNYYNSYYNNQPAETSEPVPEYQQEDYANNQQNYTVEDNNQYSTSVKSQANPVMVTEVNMGPWEKFYDDEGLPYYYNKETGQSEWEIPADQLQYYTHPEGEQYDSYNPEYSSPADPLSASKSTKSLKQSPSFKKTSSFKSVRSARSLGLLIPPPSATKMEVSFDESEALASGGSKKLKSKLSFSLKRVPSVNTDLKPKSPSPLKRKSKNGFQMLKEGAKILRKGKDDLGQVWVEYQTADDGPIFYALDETEGGQWNRPNVFNVLDDASSVEDHSVEIIDHLSEGLLSIKTPVKGSSKNNSMQSMKPTPNSKAAAPSPLKNAGKPQQEQKKPLPTTIESTSSKTDNSEDKFDAVVDPIKLMSKSYVNLGINSIIRTASSQNLKSPDGKKVLADPVVVETQAKAVLDIFTDPTPSSTTTNLKIQNIQQEAMLELQKLREKLNQAKKDFSAKPSATTTTVPATPAVKPAPAPATPVVVPATPVVDLKSPSPAKSVPAATIPVNSIAIASEPKKEPEKEVIPGPPKLTDPKVLEASVKSATAATAATSAVVLPEFVNISSKPVPLSSATGLESSTGALSITSSLSASNNDTNAASQSAEHLSTSNNNNNLSKASENKTKADNKSQLLPPKSEEKPPTNDEKNSKERVTFEYNNETYYWDEVIPRAHIIQRSLNWYCLYDTKLKLRFFKSKEGEICQLDKPIDFDGNIELMTAAPTPSSVAPSKPPSAASITKPANNEANNSNNSNKPPSIVEVTPQKIVSPMKVIATPKPNASPKPPPQQQQLQSPLKKVVSESETFFTELDLINQHEKKSKSTEKNFVSELFESFEKLQKQNQQTTQTDADILLKRLQTILFSSNEQQQDESKLRKSKERNKFPFLSTSPFPLNANNLAAASSSSSSRPMKLVSDMDKDELRKLQNQSIQSIERCCNILETIEKSPIEHCYNEQLLLLLAMKQRANLYKSFDLFHDGAALPFLQKELLFPTSKFISSYLNHSSSMKTIQQLNSSWVLKRIFSPMANLSYNFKFYYYHLHKNCYQLGEPFDLICKKNMTGLHLEKWSDYQIYTSIPQNILEKNGIEFYSDQYQGYLFYCPKRKLFSSNGIFDSPLSPINSNGKSSKSSLSKKFFSKFLPTDSKNSSSSSSSASRGNNDMKESNFYANFWNNHPEIIAEKQNALLSDVDLLRAMMEEGAGINEEGGIGDKFLMNSSLPTKGKKKSPMKNLLSMVAAANTTNNQETMKTHLQQQLQQCFQQEFQSSSSSSSKNTNTKSMTSPDPSNIIKGSRYNAFIIDQTKNPLPITHAAAIVVPHEDDGSLLPFESSMNKETFVQYSSLMQFILHYDAENPIYYLNCCEFLFYQGYGKQSLPLLKLLIMKLKSSMYFTNFLTNDIYYYYLLSMKLSKKFYGYYENQSSILQLLQSFLLIPSNVHNIHYLTFLLTHFGIYLKSIKQYKTAELFFIASLLNNPFDQLTLLHYGFLLFSKQQLALPSSIMDGGNIRSIAIGGGGEGGGYLTPINPDYKMMKKYFIRATNNPSIMNTVINESIPTHSHVANNNQSSSSSFSASLARMARLQCCWLNELVEMDKDEKESSYLGYKQCLIINSSLNNSNHPVTSSSLSHSQELNNNHHASQVTSTVAPDRKDSIQSMAYHSLGRHYQFDKNQFATAFDYYEKAIEYDADNYLAHLLYLSLSVSLKKKDHQGGGNKNLFHRKEDLSNSREKLHSSMENLLFTERATTPPPAGKKVRPSSASSSGRLGSSSSKKSLETNHANTTSHTTLATVNSSAGSVSSNKKTRPSSAQLPRMNPNHHHEAAHSNNKVHASSSQKVLPTTQLKEIKPETLQTSTSKQSLPPPQSPSSTMNYSVGLASPKSTSLRSSKNDETNQNNNVNLSSYYLSSLQVDGYYRRSLLLIEDCSYRWMILLMYADYLCYQLQDMKRAKEYYEESMKLTLFQGYRAMWGVIAYISFLQYVENDYEQLRLFFIRLLKAKHPISTNALRREYANKNASTTTGGFSQNESKYQFFIHFLHYLHQRNYLLDQNKKEQSMESKLFRTMQQRQAKNSSTFSQSMESKIIYEEENDDEEDERNHLDETEQGQGIAMNKKRQNFLEKRRLSLGEEGEQQDENDLGFDDLQEETPEEKISNAIIYLLIAHYFFDLREFSLAKQFVMESYQLHPNYLPTLRFIAIIHYYEHDLPSSNQFITKAHKLYVNSNAMTLNNLGGSAGSGSGSNSIPNVSTFLASSLPSHQPYLLRTMALIHLKQFNFTKAMSLLEKSLFSPFSSSSSSSSSSLTESSNCFLSYRLLGILYSFQLTSSSYHYSLGKEKKSNSSNHIHLYYERAMYCFQLAYQLSDNLDIESLRLQSQLLMNRHQYQEAKIYLLEILLQKNNDIITIINLALCNYYLYYTNPTQRSTLATMTGKSSTKKSNDNESNPLMMMSLLYSNDTQYLQEKKEIFQFIKENNQMKLDMMFHSKNFYHIFLIAICFIENSWSQEQSQKKIYQAASFSSTNTNTAAGFSSSSSSYPNTTDSQSYYLTGLACYGYFWFGFIEYQQIQQYLARLQQTNNSNNHSNGFNNQNYSIETDPILKQLYMNALYCFEKCLEIGLQGDFNRYFINTNQYRASFNGILPFSSIFAPQTAYHHFTSFQSFHEYDSTNNYLSEFNSFIPLTYYYLGKLMDEIDNDLSKSEIYFMKALEFSTNLNPLIIMNLFFLIHQDIWKLKNSLSFMKSSQLTSLKEYPAAYPVTLPGNHHEDEDNPKKQKKSMKTMTTTLESLMSEEIYPSGSSRRNRAIDDDHEDGREEDREDVQLPKKKKKKGLKKKKKTTTTTAGGKKANGLAGGGGGMTSDYEIDELNYFSPKRSGLFPNDPNMLSSANQYFMNNLVKFNQSNRLPSESEREDDEEEEDEEEGRGEESSKQFFQTLFDTNDFTVNGKKKTKNGIPKPTSSNSIEETNQNNHQSSSFSHEKTLKELFQEQQQQQHSSSFDSIQFHPNSPSMSALMMSTSNSNNNAFPDYYPQNMANNFYSMSLQFSTNQSILMKRLLIYQRILDHLTMKKLSYQKLFKEIIPQHSHIPSNIHSFPFIQKYFADSTISFQFLSNDWIDQYFFAFSKCEDWNYLLQASTIPGKL